LHSSPTGRDSLSFIHQRKWPQWFYGLRTNGRQEQEPHGVATSWICVERELDNLHLSDSIIQIKSHELSRYPNVACNGGSQLCPCTSPKSICIYSQKNTLRTSTNKLWVFITFTQYPNDALFGALKSPITC